MNLARAVGREIRTGVTESAPSSCCRTWNDDNAMLFGQALHKDGVVLEVMRQLGKQVDRALASIDTGAIVGGRGRLQSFLQSGHHRPSILPQRLKVGKHPLAPEGQGLQCEALAYDGWADRDGVLHLHEGRLQRGRVGQVAHSPAHHPVGLAEGEDVDHMIPGQRVMLMLPIHKVLVRVIHDQPAARPSAEIAHPLQEVLRIHDARRVARVAQGQHLHARNDRLQGRQVGEHRVRLRGTWHQGISQAGHLQRHEVIEIVRRHQAHAVPGLRQRQRHVHVGLIRSRGHHDLYIANIVLDGQLVA
mmetsp:Transcript_16338/g.62108  ORF Transcript_16338/g.62108 Transcript_16338/m.62108 type:complete len:303 (+) Transcript_16338:213-1121(+)